MLLPTLARFVHHGSSNVWLTVSNTAEETGRKGTGICQLSVQGDTHFNKIGTSEQKGTWLMLWRKKVLIWDSTSKKKITCHNWACKSLCQPLLGSKSYWKKIIITSGHFDGSNINIQVYKIIWWYLNYLVISGLT